MFSAIFPNNNNTSKLVKYCLCWVWVLPHFTLQLLTPQARGNLSCTIYDNWEKCIRVVNCCLLAPTHQVQCFTMLPSNQHNKIFIECSQIPPTWIQVALHSTSSLINCGIATSGLQCIQNGNLCLSITFSLLAVAMSVVHLCLCL